MIDLDYPIGATAIDQNEIAGLIPKHITTQSDLNEFEQFNILKAEQWLLTKKFQVSDILNHEFPKKLHMRMFNETWRWAGKFRRSEKNIGVDPVRISIELKKLNDDAIFQLENSTYQIEEIITRYHHRLVSIHPFPNGNGRHARLICDVLLKALGLSRFSWGSINLSDYTVTREKYIQALRAADKYNYELLLDFVRS